MAPLNLLLVEDRIGGLPLGSEELSREPDMSPLICFLS